MALDPAYYSLQSNARIALLARPRSLLSRQIHAQANNLSSGHLTLQPAKTEMRLEEGKPPSSPRGVGLVTMAPPMLRLPHSADLKPLTTGCCYTSPRLHYSIIDRVK